MLKNRKITKLVGCLLAVILSATAVVGSFTMMTSAAAVYITYYSGNETNSSQGNEISRQERTSVLAPLKKDTLKSATEVISGQSGQGVTDVTNFRNDGYILTGWKIGSTIYAVGDNVKSVSSGKPLTAIAQWGKESDVTINGTLASVQETSITNGKVKLSTFPAIQGEDLTVTLTPSEGFELDTFEVDDVDEKSAVNKNAYTIPAASVDESVKITASFKKQTFKLNITADEHAEVTPAPGEYTVEYGASQEITVLAKEKYEIDSVKVGGYTRYLSDNKLTLSNIKSDTNVVITTKEKKYEVTAEIDNGFLAANHGKISPTKEDVKEGEDFVLTMTPDDGYQVDKLTLDGVDITDDIDENNQYKLENVTAKHKFVAQYGTLVTHTISANSPEGVTVEPTEVTVKDRKSTTINISANDGYRITNIKVNDKDLNDIELGIVLLTNKLTLTNIREDKNIVITAEKNISSFLINASVKLEDILFGTVDPAGLKSVEEGSDYTLTIKPADNYELDVLTLDGEDVTAGVVDNKYTLTNVTAGHSFVVSFRKANYNVYTEVLPDLTGDHGSITASGSVKYGESFTVSVNPDEHYELDYLTVNLKRVDVVDNSYTIEDITSDMAVVAKFKKKMEYNFTIQAPEFVKTIPEAGTERVGYGDTKTVIINPDEGYEITKVTVNGEARSISSEGGILIISNITSDTAVEIKAKMKTFAIAAISTDILRGTVKPLLLDVVKYGEEFVLEISPNYGFELEKLTLDGVDVTSKVVNNTYTIEKVKASHAFVASFKKKNYTISINAPEGVTVDPAGPTIPVEYLDTKIIKITPDEAHRLTSVKVNGVEVSPLMIGDNLTLLAIGEDKDIVITAEKKHHNIYTQVIGGHGTISEGGSIEHGSNYTVNLYPNTGYELSSLTINGEDVTDSVVNNSYTISDIKAVAIVVAIYKKIEYPITTKVEDEGGKITTSGVAKYGDDFWVKVTAYNDYIVDTFTVDGEPAELYGDYYVFRNVTSEHTASVSFKHVPRSLNISSVEGATIEPTGSMEVEYGASEHISIEANRNYEIESVKANGVPQELPLADNTLHLENITESLTVEVTTKKVAHDVTTKVEGIGGTVSEGDTVSDKSPFTVTATPDAGYKVESISVNGDVVEFENNSYTIESVEQDTEIVVVFSEYYPAVTLKTSEGVKILTEVPEQVIYGDDLEIEIQPEAGNHLTSIKVNGEEQTLPLENNKLSILGITEDLEIEVNAEKDTYKIINGDHQTVRAESGKNMIITSNGNCKEFTGLAIDGKQLILGEDYTITCGSTIAEVNGAYLEKLEEGEHTARFSYINGNYADAEFILEKEKVKEEKKEDPSAPETGFNYAIKEGVKIGLPIIALVAVALGISVFVIKKKRNS